jgi:RNA polymerase sigma-70 factor (ECF subfamily)
MEAVEKVFIESYNQHADALFRFAFFKVNDRELAKDLLQETFMKTWSSITKGTQIENLRAFLYRTMGHLIIDEYRKKKTVSLDSLVEEGFEPQQKDTGERRLEEQLDGKRILLYINHLPEEYKDAVFMRYIEELDISEIAMITGEKPGTIAMRVHRGLKKLKELLPYETY